MLEEKSEEEKGVLGRRKVVAGDDSQETLSTSIEEPDHEHHSYFSQRSWAPRAEFFVATFVRPPASRGNSLEERECYYSAAFTKTVFDALHGRSILGLTIHASATRNVSQYWFV